MMALSSFSVVLAAVTILAVPASAFCPEMCVCDDEHLSASCVKAGLKIMPISLNPRVETITYKYNDFPTVDVSLK